MRLRGQGAQAGLAGAGRRLTLPKGKKDDRLDHEELEDGAIRAEQLPGGKVEEEEGIEGQADGDVVDDGHVEVAAGDAARTGDILGLEQTLLSNKGPPSPLALPACPSARLSEGSLSRAPRATDRSGQNTGGRAPVRTLGAGHCHTSWNTGGSCHLQLQCPRSWQRAPGSLGGRASA